MPESTDVCLVEVGNKIATVTLNRPEKRNALSAGLIEDLVRILGELDESDDVSAVILRGAGPSFCAGYDLSSETRSKYILADPVEDRWRIRRNVRRWLDLWELRVPIVAEVQGHCLAGGAEIMMMCDVVVAAEDAKIGFPSARALGVPPLSALPMLVGIRAAKRMMLTGDSVSGVEAAEMGLVTEAVPADRLESQARAIAERMTLIPKDVLAMNKATMNAAFEAMGFRHASLVGVDLDIIAHNTKTAREWNERSQRIGVRAALRERDAKFEN
ncbi:enoyl-CoA hydratase/isomerase family protein [Nocardioides sp. KIGAM211]|uniref:Enoyl-CoA hydratase/isomerase family protein n=1 Tax=Nocardioides luti TaxID=2761101 RepID=A0A7X0RG68_9ACTN|nr:enoyl-CoA hydratase/isomerase family protein [Nocardioides luti]